MRMKRIFFKSLKFEKTEKHLWNYLFVNIWPKPLLNFKYTVWKSNVKQTLKSKYIPSCCCFCGCGCDFRRHTHNYHTAIVEVKLAYFFIFAFVFHTSKEIPNTINWKLEGLSKWDHLKMVRISYWVNGELSS